MGEQLVIRKQEAGMSVNQCFKLVDSKILNQKFIVGSMYRHSVEEVLAKLRRNQPPL